MSNRTLVEINHDYCHRMGDGLLEALGLYLASGSSRDAEWLERFGFRVISMRHHSGEHRIAQKTALDCGLSGRNWRPGPPCSGCGAKEGCLHDPLCPVMAANIASSEAPTPVAELCSLSETLPELSPSVPKGEGRMAVSGIPAAVPQAACPANVPTSGEEQ